jgi:UDP-glucose 4-epimerase
LIDSFFKDKKVCITGGAGFIGSAIARRLAKISDVTIVDSLTPQYGGNLQNLEEVKNLIRIKIGDVRDKSISEELVKEVDYIFNMAGQTSHMDSMSDPYTDLEINAHAQLAILEAIRIYNPKVKIIFASTRQLYGRPDYLPVDEKHPIRPVDVNGINKNAGEQYHLLYNDVYGIKTSILRLTNTYGPGMRIKDARQTFIGIWIKNILHNKKIQVWGGNQLRDFNYVDDVVNAFLSVAISNDSNGKVFNLGSKEVISLQQLADSLISVNGSGDYEIKSFPEERKKIDIGDYYSDFNKINKLLNWEPLTNFQTGIKLTLDYYKRYGEYYLDTPM